jgi:hypothetical protein
MVLILMDEAVNGKIKVNGQVYTLVYVDATEGWKTVGQTFNQITTADLLQQQVELLQLVVITKFIHLQGLELLQ